MTRRAAILVICAAPALAADPAQDVWEVVTAMAAALGVADPGAFLAACDSGMPSYQTLRANVSALVAQADVESGIDPVRNEGTDTTREVEVDWQLQLVDRSGLQRVTRRRENIKLRFEKSGRKWKVVSLEPVRLFAPLSA
jgi:hypothetical protein